jgi:putative flavoprotein involved in K+ transport
MRAIPQADPSAPRPPAAPPCRTLARPAPPTDAEQYQVIVIGGGQAGLAAAFHLRSAGVRFVVLDAAEEVGASWLGRWDSLRLFTPVRYDALPGMAFPGQPYHLPGKADVAAYLKSYASRFELPVRLGVTVKNLRRSAAGFTVSTDQDAAFEARGVIVATGANQRPYVPSFARLVARSVVQMHSSAYRRPDQLPRGRVLVVGAGNSGAQIALELAGSGRHVLLSGRDTGSMPRRFLGRDIYDWLWPTLMRPSTDSVIGRRLMRGRLFSGDPLIGINARALERPNLVRVGRTTAVRHGVPIVDDAAVTDLSAVVWCTGFRPDFSWIEVPVLGLDGYPIHRRGVAATVEGLGFVGLRCQYRLGSALLGGVGEDARFVAGRIAARSMPR